MPKRILTLFLFFIVFGSGCAAMTPTQTPDSLANREQEIAYRRSLMAQHRAMIGIPYLSGIGGIGAVGVAGVGGGACR